MIDKDTYNIIPRGVSPSQAVVRNLDFQIRTLAEYDVCFMQDRLRADLFVNGKPTGVYAIAALGEEFTRHGQYGLQRAMETFGPDLERMVVDELIGHKYRKMVDGLEAEIEALKAHVKRVRWWQVRRRLAARRETQIARTHDRLVNG